MPHDTDPDADRRLTALEIKISYLEDLAESLSTLVYEQQRHIEVLTLELRRVRDQSAPEGGGAAFRSLRDEIPPHY